jgi:phospholipid/cholesterol/gamma-HCH transport system substrate-binding protein
MSKAFKFRYASELAGFFVLMALGLLVAGVFVTGRSQGWFERRFALRARVDSEEGIFGLEQGAEVRVRNTVAGKVATIRPTEDGGLEATFVIMERFRSFVRTDSVARIKRKFAVAGDAFVEVSPGKGPMVEDGDVLQCVKDEEIMETAQVMLQDLQSRLFPLLDEVNAILKRANRITEGLEAGQGLAGAVLRDDEMAGEVKTLLENTNGLLRDSRGAIRETTRLVRGVQRHWLVRRYMSQGDEAPLPSMGRSAAAGGEALRDMRQALDEARVADDARGVARHAYALGLALLAQGDVEAVTELVYELRGQADAGAAGAILAMCLEAGTLRARRDAAGALALRVEAERMLDRGVSAGVQFEVLRGLARAQLEAGLTEKARATWKRCRSLARRHEFKAWEAAVHALDGAILRGERELEASAKALEREADCWRDLGRYRDMALALRAAGEAYAAGGADALAADRYFRAGRSLWSAGDRDGAAEVLRAALPAAERGQRPNLQVQIDAMLRRLRAPETGTPAAESPAARETG